MITEPDARAAQLRALDVISEQRRRISELRALVVPAQHRILECGRELSWRAPSRADFDGRLAELGDRFVLAALHLADALEECDRARRAVLLLSFDDDGVAAGQPGHSGYPAAPATVHSRQAR